MKRISTLLVGFATLTGCSPDGPCTEEARSSVTVNLTDTAGDPIEGAALEFLHDDVIETCIDLGQGAYVCGWEQAGEITVFATADGYEPGEANALVEKDECHVITETLDLTLEEVICTAQVVYSVEVQVTDNDFPIDGATVNWGYQNADVAHTPCDDFGGGTHFCGEEIDGALEIYVQYQDMATYEPVDVSADECHVITEFVHVDLAAQ